MNVPCSGLLVSLVDSFLAFSFFKIFPFMIFFVTMLLQLGVYIVTSFCEANKLNRKEKGW